MDRHDGNNRSNYYVIVDLFRVRRNGGEGGKKEKMKSMTKPTSRWLGPRRGTKVCGCVHLRRRGSNFTLSLHNSGCEYNTRGAFLLHPDWIDRSRQLVARATYNRVNFRFCRLIFPSPPLLPPSLILRWFWAPIQRGSRLFVLVYFVCG